MLSHRFVVSVPKLIKRNFGICVPALQKAQIDPIQQLFVDKIREYKAKGGKIDSPDVQKELAAEREKIAKAFGGGNGVDLTQFPKFSFPEPKIELSHLEQQQK